ncbi:hypothetical protein SAMN05216312_10942 [Cohnella sp. OV330]|uniref:hypothetical protein n=1 Tax=Cohnella sp. OV330 TaxID=1855288 RepID=UPI0008E956D4|nr:hypothetical protein [Cohnella sp. OV330]SFB46692.1 hypothetical protein SAMN05216312_10942 [Cohnella sp. OV330]
MKAAWLIMAGVAVFELYRLRSGSRRARFTTMAAWLLSIGYAGTAVFADWLPLPVWIIRGLFGWADAILR